MPPQRESSRTEETNSLMRELLERLDDVNEIKIQLATMSAKMDNFMAHQEELAQAVKGNGKPGLLDRVKSLEVGLDDHAKHCPIVSIVGSIQKTLSEQEAQRKAKDEEQKVLATEKRSMKRTLTVSVLMLVLSTGVNILLVLSNLR